jgi:NTE family protein
MTDQYMEGQYKQQILSDTSKKFNILSDVSCDALYDTSQGIINHIKIDDTAHKTDAVNPSGKTDAVNPSGKTDAVNPSGKTDAVNPSGKTGDTTHKTNNTANNMNNHIDDKLNIFLGKHNARSIKTILILSGGGIKGIAHIGAMKSLDDNNVLRGIKTFVGTSVGGILAVMYCAGYSPDEMFNFIDVLDLSKLKNINPSGLLNDYGLDNGHKLEFVLIKLLEAKNINPGITFSELYKKTGIHVILATVCLNDKQVHYLSHLSTPDLSIITACRMTSSIPIYFVPVQYKEKSYVDGACIDNYPIQLFENRLDEVIGVYLTETKEFTKEIKHMEDFLFNLIQCFLEGITCNSIKGFEKQTILISLPPSGGIMNLNITGCVKKDLFDRGIRAGNKYYSECLV